LELSPGAIQSFLLLTQRTGRIRTSQTIFQRQREKAKENARMSFTDAADVALESDTAC
jgi:hypothetical protein